MYLREVGAVSATLPFTTRAGNFKLWKGEVKYKDIYNEKSFFEDLNATSISIKHKAYIDSEYSRLADKGARKLSFSSLNVFFRQINKSLYINKDRKFVLAYWAELDSSLRTIVFLPPYR